MSELVQKIVDGYTTMTKNGRRNLIKAFNRRITEFKYFVVYPYLTRKGTIDVLVGFSNDNTKLAYGEETMAKAMEQVKNNHEFISSKETDFSVLTESLIIETTAFSPIELTVPHWSQLIDAPEIMKSDFDILTESFCKYFGLEPEQYDRNYDMVMDFNSWFCNNENQPKDLDLKVVWNDVDGWDAKYGSRTINIFWKGEFIGFIDGGISRWDFQGTEYTVNYDKWSEMMEVIYASTGFVKEKGAGVVILDMNSTSVEDYASIPGVSDKVYDNE